ncbi:hypothetical protein FRC01_003154 [Tulasnella sp. 417]|nr:hypothetical protein FRC01_003154 [Tulasnella sp. 417]
MGPRRVEFIAFVDPAPDPGYGPMDTGVDPTLLAQTGEYGMLLPTGTQYTIGSNAQEPYHDRTDQSRSSR